MDANEQVKLVAMLHFRMNLSIEQYHKGDRCFYRLAKGNVAAAVNLRPELVDRGDDANELGTILVLMTNNRSNTYTVCLSF